MSEQKTSQRQKQLIPLKPYSQKELAELYGVCSRTFKKWIEPFEKEIGIKRGRYYTIPQVKVIFEKLCLPCMIETD